jgi:hypothetical protein
MKFIIPLIGIAPLLVLIYYLFFTEGKKKEYELGIIDASSSRELSYPGYKRISVVMDGSPSKSNIVSVDSDLFAPFPEDVPSLGVEVWIFEKGSRSAECRVTPTIEAKGGWGIKASTFVNNTKYLGKKIYRSTQGA